MYNVCLKCGVSLPPAKIAGRGKPRRRRCRGCALPVQEKRVLYPEMRMYLTSKSNALMKGVEHTIQPGDIPLPKTCRYLGVVLDYSQRNKMGHGRGDKRRPRCATLDRIDPNRWYTPDNIQVISDLANRMKQNATVAELIQFARGVLAAHAESPQ